MQHFKGSTTCQNIGKHILPFKTLSHCRYTHNVYLTCLLGILIVCVPNCRSFSTISLDLIVYTECTPIKGIPINSGVLVR